MRLVTNACFDAIGVRIHELVASSRVKVSSSKLTPRKHMIAFILHVGQGRVGAKRSAGHVGGIVRLVSSCIVRMKARVQADTCTRGCNHRTWQEATYTHPDTVW